MLLMVADPHPRVLGPQLATAHRTSAACPPLSSFLGDDPRPGAETVGQALTRHRKGQGLSQKELAAELTVDPSTLAKWDEMNGLQSGGTSSACKRSLE